MVAQVLVVDDSSMIRTLVAASLAAEGYGVLEAGDGIEALAVLEGNDVALVVCDVNMPNMSGLDFLEALRAHPTKAELSVLMLTTERQPELMKRARELGAKGWIVKPFKPQFLVAATKKILEGT